MRNVLKQYYLFILIFHLLKWITVEANIQKTCTVTKLKKAAFRKFKNFSKKILFWVMITLFASSHNFKTKLYKLRQYYLAVRERRQLRKTQKPFWKGFAIVDNIYNQLYDNLWCRHQKAVWWWGEFKMELLHLGKSVAKIIWAGPLNPFKLEPDPFITYWHVGSKLPISTGVRF